jgi:hypothetical protein
MRHSLSLLSLLFLFGCADTTSLDEQLDHVLDAERFEIRADDIYTGKEVIQVETLDNNRFIKHHENLFGRTLEFIPYTSDHDSLIRVLISEGIVQHSHNLGSDGVNYLLASDKHKISFTVRRGTLDSLYQQIAYLNRD